MQAARLHRPCLRPLDRSWGRRGARVTMTAVRFATIESPSLAVGANSVNAAGSEVLLAQQGVLSVDIFRPARFRTRLAGKRLRRFSSGPVVGFLSAVLQNRSLSTQGRKRRGRRTSICLCDSAPLAPLRFSERRRRGHFSLSSFGRAEPATHLLQVADDLATNFGVPGDPSALQDRLEPATAVLQVRGSQYPQGKTSRP